VNEVLPTVAPAVFKGLLVVYLDGDRAYNWLMKIGVDASIHPLPFIFQLDKSESGEAFFYSEKGDSALPTSEGVISWCN